MNGRGISRPYNKRLLSCPSAPTDKLKPQPRQPESNRNNAILHAHGGRRIVPIGSIIVPHEGTAGGSPPGTGLPKKGHQWIGPDTPRANQRAVFKKAIFGSGYPNGISRPLAFLSLALNLLLSSRRGGSVSLTCSPTTAGLTALRVADGGV